MSKDASQSGVSHHRRAMAWVSAYFGVALTLCSGAWTAQAWGEELEYGDKKINFSIPSGHCALDVNNPADARVLKVLQDGQGVTNKVLTAFAPCQELPFVRAGGELKNYGTVMGIGFSDTGEPIELPPLARSDILEAVADSMPQEPASVAFARIDRQVRSFGNKYDEMFRAMGTQQAILERAADGLYVATAQNIVVKDIERPMAGVTAFLPMGKYMVTVNVYTPFAGEKSYSSLLQTAKAGGLPISYPRIEAQAKMILGAARLPDCIYRK